MGAAQPLDELRQGYLICAAAAGAYRILHRMLVAEVRHLLWGAREGLTVS